MTGTPSMSPASCRSAVICSSSLVAVWARVRAASKRHRSTSMSAGLSRYRSPVRVMNRAPGRAVAVAEHFAGFAQGEGALGDRVPGGRFGPQVRADPLAGGAVGVHGQVGQQLAAFAQTSGQLRAPGSNAQR